VILGDRVLINLFCKLHSNLSTAGILLGARGIEGVRLAKHFAWLDAVRGIAAIAVMLFHFSLYLNLSPFFQSGYLAVDLFFLMSGFVLANAYEQKLLESRMDFRQFLTARMIRLYPLYLLATLLGAAYYFSKVMMHTADAPSLRDLGSLLALAVFFLPSPSFLVESPSGVFPFVTSAWSLSTEVFISIAYGAILFRLKSLHLLGVGLLAGAILIFFVFSYQSFDLGWQWSSFGPGFLRTICFFASGVVLYRAAKTRLSSAKWSTLLLLCLVTASLICIPENSVWLRGVAVFCIYPLFVFFNPSQAPRPVTAMICRELGRLSYPLYLLHPPILLWSAGAYKLLLHRDPLIEGSVFGWCMVVTTIALSYGVAIWFDEPVRKYLSSSVRNRGSEVVLQPA